jgi:hypothetical protein
LDVDFVIMGLQPVLVMAFREENGDAQI